VVSAATSSPNNPHSVNVNSILIPPIQIRIIRRYSLSV
jgi:hypothetical protein